MAYDIGSLGEVPQILSGVGGVVTFAGVLLVNSRGSRR
jgi:drug/metabolite transporter (DMT)-like permease